MHYNAHFIIYITCITTPILLSILHALQSPFYYLYYMHYNAHFIIYITSITKPILLSILHPLQSPFYYLYNMHYHAHFIIYIICITTPSLLSIQHGNVNLSPVNMCYIIVMHASESGTCYLVLDSFGTFSFFLFLFFFLHHTQPGVLIFQCLQFSSFISCIVLSAVNKM